MNENWHIARAREITEFALQNGKSAVAGIPADVLFAYVFYELVDRCVFVTRHAGRIVAALIARGMPEAEIRRRNAAAETLWQWERSRDSADAVYVAECVGDLTGLGPIWKQMKARWPDWRQKTFLARRHDRLVKLSHEFLERVQYGR